jgi:enterochelin esterase-like enzyme/sugar lactone lactonase YvrE
MTMRIAATAVLMLCAAALGAHAEDYTLGPDSLPQPGVPKGDVIHGTWTSAIFPGTVRDYWVYVPKQYDPAHPACVMVFQDGGWYVKEDGDWRVPTVFDNLIHRKEMPVTIGVFVSPGVVPSPRDDALPRFNRSFEYDAMGDRYARFLLEEILPEVAKSYNLAKDGNSRAIAGASSGAIAAFTAAWERADAFTRVFSSIGTYVGLRGGNDYPTLIRKTEPKPLRIFLQDGSRDMNIYAGDWYLANQEMLSALEFSGYDVNHVWGDGGHDAKHAASILPDALRWLWRDYPAPVAPARDSKQPLMTDILITGEPWRLVSEGAGSVGSVAANAKGEVFFVDAGRSRIRKVGLDGSVTVYREDAAGANALMFGPDGRLYACQNERKRIVAYDGDGRESVVAEGLGANALVVGHTGDVYVSDTAGRRIWLIRAGGEKRVVDTGIEEGSGIILTPDQSLLLVADAKGPFVCSFQIQPDGSLAHKQPYFQLHVPAGSPASGALGMAVDANGNLYVATPIGVQYCDQAGRVNGIIPGPFDARPSSVAFGGPNRDELYVTVGDKVFKRKTRARGVLSFEAPMKPPAPRL